MRMCTRKGSQSARLLGRGSKSGFLGAVKLMDYQMHPKSAERGVRQLLELG